jgi:dipeptidase E
MRLYLSSFRLGNRSDLLVDLVRRPGTPPVVAVIANSIDEGEPEHRAAEVAAEFDRLVGLGLEPYEVDLRHHVAPESVAEALDGCAGVWVRGGNAFALRHAMARSGADRVIPRLLADDALVYAGYSAGPCVLAPSLRGLELCDDPDVVGRLHGADPVWEGLGVLDRPFVPHLDSPGHPETELVARVAASYQREGVPYWALRDGQVLVVDGDLGDAVLV